MSTDTHEYLRGIALFNQGKFFEAHEVLEDVWRAAPHTEKKVWQGLVQLAVAFHHRSTGNRVGMRSVLVRAMKNMAGHPQNFHAIRVPELLESLSQWLEAFDKNRPLPPTPRMDVITRDT